MDVRDDELRRLYQQDTLREDAGDCPSAEALRCLGAGEVDGLERRRLVDHLAACSSCASEVRLARDLLAAGSAHDASHDGSLERPPLARFAWAIPAAAVLVVGMGLGLVLLRSSAPQRTGVSFRGEAPTVDAVMPADGARLGEPPAGLTWPSAAGAVHRVVLYDGDSMEIWRSGPTELDSVQLPAAVVERLADPGLYFWRVYRERDRGQSQLYSFEIAP